MTDKWKVIAIDADDTLWDCQSYFERVEQQLYGLIGPWCDDPARELLTTEQANMADLGYGCKAFTISVVETALRVGGSHVAATDLQQLLAQCKRLLQLPATPLPGVERTLQTLRSALHPYQNASTSNHPPKSIHQNPSTIHPPKIVCFTKGELQDQENKLRRSGLGRYFDDVVITSNKTEREYRQLCEREGISPAELLMVGNSLPSDCRPPIAIGAWAVHVPFHVTWQLEHAADFAHPRLKKIEQFSELLNLLGITA